VLAIRTNMKYKTTIEVTPDQIQAIVKAHFEKQALLPFRL
jgi:hypothetical protein